MAFAPHPLTLRQLQYFAAVAETRSFRAAAALCHVSQPALSAQIAQLEGALQVTLFERDHRPVLITAAGEAVLARARALLRDTDDLVAAALRFRDPLSGTLRIGMIPTVSPYVLPEVARALREDLPRLSLVYTEDKTSVLVRALELGELDAAFLALEAELSDLESEPLVRDPFVLAVSRDHRLAKHKQPVKLSELTNENVLLLDDGHCLREQALVYCQRAKLSELGFRATSLATLTQMVAGGAGVTLLPSLAVSIENRRGDLAILPFAPPEPARTLGLVFRRGAPIRAGLLQVGEVIRRAAEPLVRTPVSRRKAG